MSRSRRPARRTPSRRPQRRKAVKRHETSGAMILSVGVICLVFFVLGYVGSTLAAGMARQKANEELAWLSNMSQDVRGDLSRQVARSAQFLVVGKRMGETMDKGDEEADLYVSNLGAESEQEVQTQAAERGENAVTED